MPNKLTAKEIIFLHKNPVKTNNSFGKKLFVPKNTEQEITEVNQSLEAIKKLLKTERVERRHVRLEAVWLPDIERAKVTRRVGNIPSNFGHDVRGDLYLLPEEALFLLEMNRLELLSDGIPFSIEQGYTYLLGENSSCSLQQYRIFQNLALQSFHIKRSTNANILKPEENSKKRKFEEKTDIVLANIDSISPNLKEMDTDHTTLLDTDNYVYNIYSSESSANRKLKHKLKLQSGTDQLHASNISTKECPVLTSLSGVDSVAFYQLEIINFDCK